MAKATKKVDYNNFTPSTPKAIAANAKFDKGTALIAEARAEMTAIVVEQKGIKGDDAKRIAAGKKWGQWSWWVSEEGNTTKAKGEEL